MCGGSQGKSLGANIGYTHFSPLEFGTISNNPLIECTWALPIPERARCSRPQGSTMGGTFVYGDNHSLPRPHWGAAVPGEDAAPRHSRGAASDSERAGCPRSQGKKMAQAGGNKGHPGHPHIDSRLASPEVAIRFSALHDGCPCWARKDANAEAMLGRSLVTTSKTTR